MVVAGIDEDVDIALAQARSEIVSVARSGKE